MDMNYSKLCLIQPDIKHTQYKVLHDGQSHHFRIPDRRLVLLWDILSPALVTYTVVQNMI